MKNQRNNFIARLENENWDIVVIGGGATGLGTALDAATRGLKTLLIEQHDYAKATSSRSTKLVHGGVRYLERGDVLMVREALIERGRMLRNAPHLVVDMRFIIGAYRWWERIFYTIGLTFYDILAGSLGFGRSLPLSKKTVIKDIPQILQKNLRGGIVYHDGQFDDARMATTLMLSAIDAGAVCLNYVKAIGLTKDHNGKICEVKARDEIEGNEYTIKTKSVINCTGIFVDEIMMMDTPEASKKVRPSRGVHLVVDKSFLGGNNALMIPKTVDGRVLFGVPWHNKVILGTTDIPVEHECLEPKASEEEIGFILEQAGKYLTKKPTRKDILCVYAGLRPLAAPSSQDDTKKTKEISRSHKIYQSKSGLISITGGKWTTYRAMAEEVVDIAVKNIGANVGKSKTANLKLHGYKTDVDRSKWDYVYGSDITEIEKIISENPEHDKLLHPNYTFKVAHVIFAARKEQALSVEDVLARRVRLMILDARAAIEIAPKVAEILAKELGKDDAWKSEQIESFNLISSRHLV